ncbi:MAG: winged helix-turn-helix domain-containing protein [Burkholderiaceae bacterium]
MTKAAPKPWPTNPAVVRGCTARPERRARARSTPPDRRQHARSAQDGLALWSRQAVQRLIKQRCGVLLTVQGVGLYLRRWGFTRKSPSSAPMSSNPRRCAAGSMSNTRDRATCQGRRRANSLGRRDGPALGRCARAQLRPMGQTPEYA